MGIIARLIKAHVDAAHLFVRLWNMAAMKSGIAAPEPLRTTVLAAKALATY